MHGQQAQTLGWVGGEKETGGREGTSCLGEGRGGRKRPALGRQGAPYFPPNQTQFAITTDSDRKHVKAKWR